MLGRESGAKIGGSSVMRLALRRAVGLGPATLSLLFALSAPVPAWAASGPVDSGGTAWVLVASALVLFMTLPGLALFYGGLVRSRNLLSVLMHCFVICCIVSLLWMLFGYSLVFDTGSPWLGGFGKA